jgi:hypothetical protein
MNRAEQVAYALQQKRMSWNELFIEAQEIAKAIDQDWENETTTYEYADGSIAVFNGMFDTILTYTFE